jgi:tetratricopeptide (TPR) repeat protein
MSSVIEGYNYDIFISYRQKDNKYDGWVTEFVDNLQKELQATFKEEISLYFDINPHDGLLETHDVDASLKEKLKCLIFIPIISRTYCDPNSFAWEHEFKEFVEMASKDQFGLKIRLPVGNVASRVLPVRIYDLDEEDINLCESVLGSALRGVEFIYNSAGVNRPLRSKEEKPSENLKKTIYRDQINKISNAIREIVTGLRAGQGVPGKEKNESSMPWEEAEKEKLTGKEIPTGFNKQKILSGIIPVAIILVLLGIYVYPKLFQGSDKTNVEKSVAIMPFKNLTGDKANDYIAEIQHNALYQELGKISQVKSLRVVGPTTTNVFEVNRMSIAGFARKVYVDYLVEGFVLSLGETQEIMIRVTQLFPEERVVFAENYASEPKNILKLYFNIASLIAQKIGFELLPQDTVRLTQPQIVNPQSFEAYSRGMIEIEKGTEEGINKGLEYLNEAVKLNPDDPLANAGLALGYLSIAHEGMDPGNALEKGEEYAFKAMKLDSTNAYVHTALAETYLYVSWKYPESERHFKRALALNPNLDMAHYHYAWALYLWGRMDEAIAEHKLAQKCDPYNPLHTAWLGGLLCYAGRYEEAIQEALKSFEIQKDYPLGYAVLVDAYLGLGRTDEALEVANKIKVDTQDSGPLFKVYLAMGRREAALELLKEYERADPPNQYALVLGNASLGRIDEAFRWLNYEPHSMALPWLALEKLSEPLHSDPRWDEFLKRVNLLSQ